MAIKKTLSELSILVLDDDPFIVEIVSMNLARLGVHFVTPCYSGNEVLNRIDAGECFDLAMLDLNLPEMDGIEVLRQLAKRNYRGCILLFSGEDSKVLKAAQNLANAHNLNVLGSIKKPVSAEELLKKLEKIDASNGETKSAKQAEAAPVCAKDLELAINHQQIIPYFQPKVCVSDRTLWGVEVLARWLHPKHGVIVPNIFIPMAEQHGLINSLTWSVFEQALEICGGWHKQGASICISMNLSAQSLELVDLPERIESMANSNGMPHNAIVLEITESGLIENLTASLDVLTRLRLKGFGLSIDDFGTGYSSMAQLQNIPFTGLKIDRAFVHGTAEDAEAHAILQSSAQLAKELELIVVAEGVENQADWDEVARVGCDFVQGYFIAKPMPKKQFEIWMAGYQKKIKNRDPNNNNQGTKKERE